jgi:chromate transporter
VSAGAVLDGVTVASLALMAAVTVQLGHAALVDIPTVALAVVATALLVRFRIASLWLLALGAAFGFARALL